MVRTLVPSLFLNSADFLSPGFLGKKGLLPLHLPADLTMRSSIVEDFEHMSTG